MTTGCTADIAPLTAALSRYRISSEAKALIKHTPGTMTATSATTAPQSPPTSSPT
jgi:hypothetical protein